MLAVPYQLGSAGEAQAAIAVDLMEDDHSGVGALADPAPQGVGEAGMQEIVAIEEVAPASSDALEAGGALRSSPAARGSGDRRVHGDPPLERRGLLARREAGVEGRKPADLEALDAEQVLVNAGQVFGPGDGSDDIQDRPASLAVSPASARARAVPEDAACKALLHRAGDTVALVVVPGDQPAGLHFGQPCRDVGEHVLVSMRSVDEDKGEGGVGEGAGRFDGGQPEGMDDVADGLDVAQELFVKGAADQGGMALQLLGAEPGIDAGKLDLFPGIDDLDGHERRGPAKPAPYFDDARAGRDLGDDAAIEIGVVEPILP